MLSLSALLAVYAVYFMAVASPGPSTLMIMGVSMGQGRRAGLILAAGVWSGSLCWAVLTATGLSALLASYAQLLTAIKIIGGCYLFYLAWRSARSALRPVTAAEIDAAMPTQPMPALALYRRGLLMHLSNPKAILAWLSMMSIGLQPGQPAGTLAAIALGCAVIGATVFISYALVFSTGPAIRAYRRTRRGVDIVLAGFFGLAAVKTLSWNPAP